MEVVADRSLQRQQGLSSSPLLTLRARSGLWPVPSLDPMLHALLLTACAAFPPLAEVRLDSLGDPLPPVALARLGTLRLFHPGEVWAIAFLPDGKVVATSGREMVRLHTSWRDAVSLICLWEVETGPVTSPLAGAAKPGQSPAFSPPMAEV